MLFKYRYFLIIIPTTFFFLLALSIFLLKNNNTERAVFLTSDCENIIDEINSIDDLMRKGNEYFGGSKNYNLTCGRQAYEKVISLKPNQYSNAYYQLGRIDFIESHFDQALKNFSDALEIPGYASNVYYMIGLTYGYKARKTNNDYDWKLAELGFEKFLELEPANPWGSTDLSWIYFSQGKYQDMKPVLELSLAQHPDHMWLNNMYGLYLLNTNEPRLAITYFEKAEAIGNTMTEEDWGRAYPGNDPANYEEGLAEMHKVIKHNLEQASVSVR